MELALDQFLFFPFRAQHNAQHRVEQENLHAHAQKSALGKKWRMETSGKALERMTNWTMQPFAKIGAQ